MDKLRVIVTYVHYRYITSPPVDLCVWGHYFFNIADFVAVYQRVSLAYFDMHHPAKSLRVRLLRRTTRDAINSNSNFTCF